MLKKKKGNPEADTGGEQPYLSRDGQPWVIPHRRLKQRVRAVVLANREKVLITFGTAIRVMLFIVAYMYEYVGNFTINLNKVNMYRKGISLSSTADFKEPISYIKAPQIKRATNVAISELPSNLRDTEGNNSSVNYLAYTFFLTNGGTEDTEYYMSIAVDTFTGGAENAVWIALYCDDEDVVYYARANQTTGQAEEGTVAWVNDQLVMERHYEHFAVGETHRYSIVIFVNGEDPDCIPDIINGMARFSMDFDTISATGSRNSLLDLFK